MTYASLGDTDQAMNWLERGYEERFNPGVLLRPDSILSAPTRASQTFCTAFAYPRENQVSGGAALQ